jgi:hypothetical protein
VIDGPVALIVGLCLAVGLLLEARVLVRWRVDAWFHASVPLAAELVPIPRAPRGAGRTSTVRWEVGPAHVVRFWSDPSDRAAPLGLHGVVILRESRRGVELDVRWAPPLTLVLGPLWLALLGAARGDGPLLGAVALTLSALGAWWYGRAALRAAAELRWSFLEACGDGPGGV